VATLLGLGYPGGPAIEQLAAQAIPGDSRFPAHAATKATSFLLRLKTAVLRAVRASDNLERDRPHWPALSRTRCSTCS